MKFVRMWMASKAARCDEASRQAGRLASKESVIILTQINPLHPHALLLLFVSRTIGSKWLVLVMSHGHGSELGGTSENLV